MKKTNRQTIEHMIQHRKLKNKQHEPHQKLGVSQVLRKGKQISPDLLLTFEVVFKRRCIHHSTTCARGVYIKKKLLNQP